ncbi:MAG: hypothetical protein J6C93_00270 [Clostridia bacterium]|nr:hypothetical protein [Clostridia bacterium]
MRELLQSTTAYQTLLRDAKKGELSHATLVVFPDAKYLRALLRECATAYFYGDSRKESLVLSEGYSECRFFPSVGGKLTVDDGAAIVEESLLRPLEGEKKLFVLDEFHNASVRVQNKLLKILEEPPQGVFFLLGATADFSVLPTVLSRVKKLEVAPFQEEQIKRALLRNFPTARRQEESASACGGIYSVAEELLSGGGKSFRLAEEFLLGKEREKTCRNLGDGKDGEKQAFFSAVRLILRDALMVKTGNARYVSADSQAVNEVANAYPVGALVASLEYVTEAEKEIKFNANFGQCAHVLAIRMEEEKKKWQKLS